MTMIARNITDRVLVIDDELGPRESLRILLKNDYEVFCATSVEEGIGLLKSRCPDIVILDIRMPGQSGIEGLRHIRQLDPSVSVVMLTGYAALETAQEALRLGANDYLKKPFDTVEIRHVIDENIRRTRIERKRAAMTGELAQLNDRLSALTTYAIRSRSFTATCACCRGRWKHPRKNWAISFLAQWSTLKLSIEA